MRRSAFIKLIRAIQQEQSQHWNTLRLQQQWRAQGVEIASTAMLRLDSRALLEIGAGTVIGPYSIIDLLSDPASVDAPASKLVIGKRVAINEFNNIRVGGAEVYVGDGCLISQFVSIIGSNHSLAPGSFIQDQPWDVNRKRIMICQDVWIGTHAVILPGVQLGAGSVIAAGAVVTSDVPENAIAAGVPARIIGYRK